MYDEDVIAFIIFIIIFGVIIAAFLALIPASIAKKKGHSFGLWWLYGWALFLIAFIHSLFVEDINVDEQNDKKRAVEELKLYKELLDQNAIDSDEYNAKASRLLKIIRED